MRLSMKENLIYVNDVRLKIVLINKQEPYLLKSYSIKLKKGTNNLELKIEDFLYKLTEKNRTLLRNDIYYERPNLWELNFFTNSFSIEIPSFEKIADRVKKILLEYFDFDRETLDIIEYFYAKSEFDTYIRSFHNPRKACEMFYKYRMKINMPFDKFISGDFKPFLKGYTVKRGGKFCGCYIDNEDRKRPRTSRVYYETEFDVQDKFIFKTIKNLPIWIKFHIISKYITEEKIFYCYGGKEKALNDLQKLNSNITDNTRLAKFLKVITLTSNNELVSTDKVDEILFDGIEGVDKYLEVYEKFRAIIESDFNVLFKFIYNKSNRNIAKLIEYSS